MQHTSQQLRELQREDTYAPADGSFASPRLATSTLVGVGRCRSLDARDVIYREGDQVERIFLIRNGMVKLLSHLPNGRSRIVRIYTRGQWLGLEGLLGQAYQHAAIAVDKLELEQFSMHGLLRRQTEEPRLFSRLMSQWQQDLMQADRWIAEFSTGSIKSRVARLLIYLAELVFGRPAEQVTLLTVNEMAEILGVTPESVSRILARYKRRAILRRVPDTIGEVYRLDVRRLQQESFE